MKHSKDVRLVNGNVLSAKLKKAGNSYVWRGWKIQQATHVSNLKLSGKKGYYVEHEERGIWFAADNLLYVRGNLPDFEVLSIKHDGTEVPKGCHMTAERKKRVREARSPAEKVAAANEFVVRILKNKVAEAKRERAEFTAKAATSIHAAVSWGHTAIMYDFIGEFCTQLLLAPMEQLPRAVTGMRKQYAEGMLRNYYGAVSSGTMQRAVDSTKADAVHRFIDTCDICIAAYEREGVELEDSTV